MTAHPLGPEFDALCPPGGYGLIMADPPWAFVTRSERGVTPKGAGGQYALMPLAAIRALPVERLASPSCLLWLWATNPMLPDALGVMAAWGFQFRTAGTWVKRTRHGKTAMGTGYILRSANEPFLLGVRGAPRCTRATRSVVATGAEAAADWADHAVTIEARRREHSRKPDAAFVAAEVLLPGVPRIELFSREARPGWDAWGNETGKFDRQGRMGA